MPQDNSCHMNHMTTCTPWAEPIDWFTPPCGCDMELFGPKRFGGYWTIFSEFMLEHVLDSCHVRNKILRKHDILSQTAFSQHNFAMHTTKTMWDRANLVHYSSLLSVIPRSLAVFLVQHFNYIVDSDGCREVFPETPGILRYFLILHCLATWQHMEHSLQFGVEHWNSRIHFCGSEHCLLRSCWTRFFFSAIVWNSLGKNIVCA